MNQKFRVVNTALIIAELAILIFFILSRTCLGWDGPNHVAHRFGGIPIALLAVGSSSLLTIFLFCSTLFLRKSHCVVILGIGLSCLGVGACLCEPSRPVYKLFGRALNAKERIARFGATQVVFDPGGGDCDETIRIVKRFDGYGKSMNLYPSEDIRNFTFIRGVALNPRFGVFYLNADNSHGEMPFVNYYSAACIDPDMVNGKWRYIVEILTLSDVIRNWVVGSTPTGGADERAQMTFGKVGASICKTGLKIVTLTGQAFDGEIGLLDRAYMHLADGVKVAGSFRVSLFAGTGVNESNYHYVKPGETLACKLPVPMREGYVFEGWYDGEKRVTEETKVEKREAHTLKARWRKL